ncbi:hypothetical protein RB195_008606 [Necator americanus]|uniref:Reverse transcriptase domain-containing protein n=1 Tax=Necator americanus TaxID=51031 RepID=A0ABR1CPE6_NECAM
MAICTYNARTLASEAAIEDLMMQAKKIKYDVIGLTETRRRHPLNAVYETGEELFLGTCDSRGVGGVGVLVNTSMAKNIDSFEQLTTRIGRLRMRRCGPIPALTIFVVYAPTSSYEEEEVEAFYMDLEKFYQEDHAFYKVIVGDFNAKVGPRRTPEELHIGTHGLQWNDQGERLSEFIMTTKTIHGNSQFQKPSSLRWTWESPGGGYRNEIDHIIVNKRFCLTDVGVVPKFYTGSDHRLLRGRFSFTRRAEKAAKFRERNPRTTINWDLFATLVGFWEDSAMDNIDEEYDRLVEHLHDCAKKAESFKPPRGRGAARAAGNQELTSELARLCREAIKEDLKERRAEVLAEAAEAGKSIRYARRDFASRKTRMTALRNPKGTAIASRRGMEKIIYDFYSDLFDSHVHLPPHHLREDGQVIPEVLPSEIRHAIMSVRNRTAPGPDRIRPEHLKSLPPVLINTLARLFTRYLSECKVPKQWKTSKTVLLYKKGDPYDIGNYRPICLLSVIYKLFTRVILNRIEKVLDEGQPCKQAGFRKGFSTIDHIHTVSKLIEVSREYKMPLCLTFIDLKKAFDSVETEAVVEALDNQGVPTQYIRVLRELYSNFTTGISPFYKNIIIDVKRGVRQGDTISPKIFTATLENAMRKLEWDDMGVKVDGRQLHHLRFADDIVLVTPSISQAERMLTEFDETCGCIGLQLNLQKTMFMRNGWVSDAPFTLNGTNISECTSYVYLGRELNMMNDLTPELGRRRRAAWGAYKSIEDVVKKTRNTRLRAHLFNTTVLPALTYASETWAFRKQEENAVSVIERAIERVMLGVSRFTQVRDGIRSSLLRQRSKIRDAAAFAKESKIRWAGHVMRFNDNRWTRAKNMMLFVSHAKGGTTGLLWHAIGTNGRITGARSTSSKINGSQGQGDQEFSLDMDYHLSYHNVCLVNSVVLYRVHGISAIIETEITEISARADVWDDYDKTLEKLKSKETRKNTQSDEKVSQSSTESKEKKEKPKPVKKEVVEPKKEIDFSELLKNPPPDVDLNDFIVKAAIAQTVVNPLLVKKIGNIDDQQTDPTKQKEQLKKLEEQMRSKNDTIDEEKDPKKPPLQGVKWGDTKCVLYETKDQLTLEDDGEDADLP